MTRPVLIIGGYGVVGLQLAKIIRDAHPAIPLILAGRSLDAAQNAAAKIENATGFRMDVAGTTPILPAHDRLAAVIAAVNDPEHTQLRAAILQDIPYIDVTRWTERLNDAIELAAILDVRSSVSLSSSWMAGISAIVAKSAASKLASVERIETSILLRLADKAGPNSVEYTDRLGYSFRVMQDGRWRDGSPMSEPTHAEFPSGFSGKVYRFDEPSQETLARYTGAKSVSSRIGYDNATTNMTMAFLVKSGLWWLISGSAFRKFRRWIIYNPGDGAAHEIVITAAGRDSTGQVKKTRATINDPRGQTHLTAIGAFVQLQEALGLGGRPVRGPGIYVPENHDDPDHVVGLLRRYGVEIEIVSEN